MTETSPCCASPSNGETVAAQGHSKGWTRSRIDDADPEHTRAQERRARIDHERDAYAIAQNGKAFHEAVVETSASDLKMRLIQTTSGRNTWRSPDQQSAGRGGVPRPRGNPKFSRLAV
jgi:hypothetical protein